MLFDVKLFIFSYMGCVKKIFFLACLATGICFAVPAINRLIPSEQPDGSVIYIRKVGNEHFHYTMTEDSLMIVKDKHGYWNYADENGKSTGKRTHRMDKRDKAELDFLKSRHSKKIRENFESRGWNRVRTRMDSLKAQSSSSSDKVMRAWGFQSSSSVASGTGPTRPPFDKSLTTGEIRGIVILVEFSDVRFKASDANAEYTDYLNKEGYNKFSMAGSVRDFFIKNSSGVFTPTFDVVGPITLPKTRDYYGGSSTGFYGGGLEDRAPEALGAALDSLNAKNYDFSPYDNDHDGVVDFVYMVYAGIGAADTDYDNAIWPHSYSISKKVRGGSKGTLYTSRYACSNEINGSAYSFNRNTNTMDGIGTFCHEFSHVLGLMDHYNTNNGGVNPVTPYEWDLMDAGSYNCAIQGYNYNTACSPANLSAFERFSLGWLTPREIGSSDTVAILKSISENDAYILPTSDNNEYYMLEYRLQEDFDRGLPGHGMLIWHIKYDKRAWSNNLVNTGNPLGVDLVEADGKAGPYTISSDAFPGKGVYSYDGFKSWKGDDLGLSISEIKEHQNDGYVEFLASGTHKGPEPVSSSSEESSSSLSSSLESSSSTVLSSSAESYHSLNFSSAAESSASLASSSSFEISSSTLNLGRVAAPAVSMNISVVNKVVSLKTDASGHKLLRLFDANGLLLASNDFDADEMSVSLNAKQGTAVVLAVLYVNGHPAISRKIQIR